MKEPLNRTKVVVRHLPPSLSQSSFFDQIDGRFSSRYNWSSFRCGKSRFVSFPLFGRFFCVFLFLGLNLIFRNMFNLNPCLKFVVTSNVFGDCVFWSIIVLD